jgi:adenylate cyclase
MLSRSRQFLLFGLIATVFGMLAGAVPAVLRLEENFGLASLFLMRGPREAPAEVVVVSLDKRSSDAFGLPNEPAKWPRTLHAELVERLVADGAAVIGFDVLFDNPAAVDADARLGAALGQAGNVVLAAFLHKTNVGASQDGRIVLSAEKLIPPVSPIAAGALALAVAPFALPVVPVRVSQFWTFKASAGNLATFPTTVFQAWMLRQPGEWYADLRQSCADLQASLPATPAGVLAERQLENLLQRARRCLTGDAAALATLEAAWQQSPQPLALRSLLQLYAGADTRYLNYYGPVRTVWTVPYVQALRGEGPELAGKIVLVGFSDEFQPEQKDGFYSVFSDHTGLDISGVEVAATAVANMLDGTAIRPLSFPAELFVIGFWGLLVGGFCRVLTPLAAIAFSLCAVPLYAVWAWWVFDAMNIWLPLFVPLFVQLPVALLLGLVANYLQTRNQRERVMQALGTYLPKRALDRLMENLGDLQGRCRAPARHLHGHRCRAVHASCRDAVAGRTRNADERLLRGDVRRGGEVRRRGHGCGRRLDDGDLGDVAAGQPDPGARLCRRTGSCGGRRAIQCAAGAAAVADPHRSAQRDHTPRHHRRRGAPGVSCRRRHRQYRFAHRRPQQATRHAHPGLGRYAGGNRRPADARAGHLPAGRQVHAAGDPRTAGQ